MRIRQALAAVAEAMAAVMAAVAPEDVIATEPPVDVAARAIRFRAMLQGGAA